MSEHSERVEREAYIMLEIEQAVVARAAKVSPLFQQLEGGEQRIWEALEASDLVEARRLIEFRERLTKEQRGVIPFEAIVIAAGMTPRHAFGVVSEAMVGYSQDAAKLILHSAAPEMMKQAVLRAIAPGGTADGRTLLQALNLVPRPKNTITIVNGDVVKGNKNQLAVLPNPEDTGRRIGDRFNVDMTIPLLVAPEIEDENDDDGI